MADSQELDMKRWTKPELIKLRGAAVAWFQTHGRSLPWRETRDPYRIWVSEIMLQQTVVAAVIPYYHKFLSTFPDVVTLADAQEQHVLQHWAGLGYYRRAKQLHAAAQVIRDSYDGLFPSEFTRVLDLPGIGRYTAGAILSFAYDQPYPIVEANTQRLYARLLRLPGQFAERSVQTALWNFAESFLPDGPGSGEVNQSMMELGSQICTPKSPRCSECPLRDYCPTYKHGEQEQIPSPKPPRVYEERLEAVLMVQNAHQQFLMRRCGPEERWAGLWDFPRFDVTDCTTDSEVYERLQAVFTARFGHPFQFTAESPSIKHGVTRYKITLRCFHGVAQASDKVSENVSSANPTQDQLWCTVSELSDLPLSSTGKKLSIRLREPDVAKTKSIAHNKNTRKTHR
ncbi:MAG: A/G-specific adenine glycosylase [Pirellula sp.]|jgi:A/G-specific adenine glycosylase